VTSGASVARTTQERRLQAIDALLVDLRARGEHREAVKVARIRSRIARGQTPGKGDYARRLRPNVKPAGRLRMLPTLEPIT
jgi:hypothetical protein